MDRNQFLAQALPTWLGRGFAKVIIVDWNSREPVTFLLEQIEIDPTGQGIQVVRSEKHERNRYFNDGWARNTGARLCDSDFVLFMDSDIMIRDGDVLVNDVVLDPDTCLRGNIPGGYGTCLVSRED
jgi:glycosyltransferase involved in cell wall biosynthesis